MEDIQSDSPLCEIFRVLLHLSLVGLTYFTEQKGLIIFTEKLFHSTIRNKTTNANIPENWFT